MSAPPPRRPARPAPDGYRLARGAGEALRLRLLHNAYAAGSEALLKRAGLRPGMRVVELGCGTGNMTCWLAERVGSTGLVVGLDNSRAQLALARRQAEARHLVNATFGLADIHGPGLPRGRFDLAYARLLLMHLTDPIAALRAMKALVRPGGVVVCEEMDLSRWLCDPPSALVARSHELKVALSDRYGQHWRLGTSLHRVFRRAGFRELHVSAHQPLVLRGEEKRLTALSFAQLAPHFVKEGLASRRAVAEIAAEMERLAADETTLFGLPFMGQVWAVR